MTHVCELFGSYSIHLIFFAVSESQTEPCPTSLLKSGPGLAPWSLLSSLCSTRRAQLAGQPLNRWRSSSFCLPQPLSWCEQGGSQADCAPREWRLGVKGRGPGQPQACRACWDGPPQYHWPSPGSQPGWALPALALGCQPEDWPAAQTSKTLTPGEDDQGTPAPRL